MFNLLSTLHRCVEALEEALLMSEKRHQKELQDQAKIYKERLDGMLALIHALQLAESWEKKIAKIAPTNLPSSSSEDECGGAPAAAVVKNKAVVEQPEVLPTVVPWPVTS